MGRMLVDQIEAIRSFSHHIHLLNLAHDSQRRHMHRLISQIQGKGIFRRQGTLRF